MRVDKLSALWIFGQKYNKDDKYYQGINHAHKPCYIKSHCFQKVISESSNFNYIWICKHAMNIENNERDFSFLYNTTIFFLITIHDSPYNG